MQEAAQWIEEYRTFWEGALDALAAYLENPAAAKKPKRNTKTMSPKTAPTSALKLKRSIKAPIARVFAAWTNPEDILQWFGPGAWKVTAAKLELRPGGSWRVCFHSDAENRDVEVYGVYREVKPNTRLVFTWNSDNPQMNIGETLVTVDLTEASGSTDVCITHEGFPAQPIRERHSLGWQNCCDNLEKLLATSVARQ